MVPPDSYAAFGSLWYQHSRGLLSALYQDLLPHFPSPLQAVARVSHKLHNTGGKRCLGTILYCYENNKVSSEKTAKTPIPYYLR